MKNQLFDTEPRFPNDPKQKKPTRRHVLDKVKSVIKNIESEERWLQRSIKRLHELTLEKKSLEDWAAKL